MTDPAVEAAQRACSCAGTVHSSRCLAAAAREALKPIRELHKPEHGNCNCCIDCAECGQGWPCDTAKLIYPTEELER